MKSGKNERTGWVKVEEEGSKGRAVMVVVRVRVRGGVAGAGGGGSRGGVWES